MKTMTRVLTFVLLGLLTVGHNGYAVTIDSLQRSLNMMEVSNIQSPILGTFSQGLSWPGDPQPYNSNLGYYVPGARVYQETNVLNDVSTMTANGHGGFNVWWPQNEQDANQTFSVLSRLLIEFTPLTGASYDYAYGSDGGIITFQDTVTGDYLYNGSGFLIAGHKYQVEADASISNLAVTNYGAFWGMELTVQEQPSNAPIPGAFLLFAPGLAGLAAMRRKMRK
jgi:hypothetical protein